MAKRYLIAMFILLSMVSIGCNRNPYMAAQPGGTGAVPGSAATAAIDAQVTEMQRRAQMLDDNNRQLTTQLAQSQQQVQVYRERSDLLQKQLQDVSTQLQQTQMMAANTQQQVRGLQASTQFRGGATITANNSLARQAEQLRIPGAIAAVDGDVIRIRIQSDQIFTAGSAQLTPNATTILDPLADAIVRGFPRQRIGIEGHCDNGPLYGGSFATAHQLSSAQAGAIFEQWVRRNQIAPNQLFMIGHGTNHPRADNQSATGRAENRRIEIVIYPDRY